MRYLHFSTNDLIISNDFARYFRSEHFERFANEFARDDGYGPRQCNILMQLITIPHHLKLKES